MIYCYFTENTSMDFRKVIHENVEKKAFISEQTDLDILKFKEVLFCTYCKGVFCL